MCGRDRERVRLRKPSSLLANIGSMASESPTFDIIILGAGLAGLTAAVELQKHNQKVLVLEGQDRIGGRIQTIPANTTRPGYEDQPPFPCALELGASWVTLLTFFTLITLISQTPLNCPNNPGAWD